MRAKTLFDIDASTYEAWKGRPQKTWTVDEMIAALTESINLPMGLPEPPPIILSYVEYEHWKSLGLINDE